MDLTRATTSASTTGKPLDLKRLETVLFPVAIPPVNPIILIVSSKLSYIKLLQFQRNEMNQPEIVKEGTQIDQNQGRKCQLGFMIDDESRRSASSVVVS